MSFSILKTQILGTEATTKISSNLSEQIIYFVYLILRSVYTDYEDKAIAYGVVTEKNKDKWTQSRQSEYRELLLFFGPQPDPKQGPSLWGRNLSIAQAHSLGPHQDTAQPKLGSGSLSDAGMTLDHLTDRPFPWPLGFWRAHPSPSHRKGSALFPKPQMR